MSDREDITVGGLSVSPLSGAKIVTQEDIPELFGDIGTLRRAKLVIPGHAEVTFMNKNDAARAVEIYHNKQMDEKHIECQIAGDATDSIPQTTPAPRLIQGRNAYMSLKAITNKLVRTKKTASSSL